MIEFERVTMLPPPTPSSQIVSLGYSAKDRCLYVEFKGTGTYRYHDMMPGVYEKLLKAESVGKFISKEIAPNHGFEKVYEAVNLKIKNDIIFDALPPEEII